MFAAYTQLCNAEKVKRFLIKKDLLHSDFLPIKEFGTMYFPMKKRASVPKAKVVKTKFSFSLKKKNNTLKELLGKKLTEKELQLLPKAQEIVGKILILEIPAKLEKKEKLIAEAYLKLNKQIETVVKKKAIHSGVFRTRTVRILAGKKRKETLHKENGVRIKLHLEQTYFSARLANERLRIAQQVKPKENVLVMFSGVAPYPLVLARHSPSELIYCIEMNPLAHRYALDNVALNKFEDKIKIIEGNVRKIIPKLRKKFERILMPLPRTGEQFLNLAFARSKKGTIIHLYDFLNENEVAEEVKKIRKICKEHNQKVKFLRKVKCGQFAPGAFRYCFDLKVQ